MSSAPAEALSQPAPGRRKVLLVVDSLDVGGAERHVVGLARALLEAGYVPTITCSTEGALAPIARLAGVPVQPLLGRIVKRRVSLAFARGLGRFIRAERADLVHAHGYASAAAAALAVLGTGMPLVLTEHSEASWRTPRARLVSKLVYRRASRVIAVSESIRGRLLEKDRVPAARVVVIPNTLLSLPEPTGVTEQPLRFASGSGPLVGVVARLTPEKGVRYFIQAAARVSPALPSARFVVIGDGPEREPLLRLTEQLALRDKIDFVGFRLDAAALLTHLDLLAVPSLSEGTPLVVLEAMQARVPVVASAVGGVPEQIAHGRDGWLVPPGDVDALADALLLLLRAPERASQLAEAAQLRISTCASPHGMLRQIERAYCEAVASR